MEVAGKKITELRVVDLRHILEKRGLEKSGNKSVLIERLAKVNVNNSNVHQLGIDLFILVCFSFTRTDEAFFSFYLF